MYRVTNAYIDINTFADGSAIQRAAANRSAGNVDRSTDRYFNTDSGTSYICNTTRNVHINSYADPETDGDADAHAISGTNSNANTYPDAHANVNTHTISDFADNTAETGHAGAFIAFGWYHVERISPLGHACLGLCALCD